MCCLLDWSAKQLYFGGEMRGVPLNLGSISFCFPLLPAPKHMCKMGIGPTIPGKTRMLMNGLRSPKMSVGALTQVVSGPGKAFAKTRDPPLFQMLTVDNSRAGSGQNSGTGTPVCWSLMSTPEMKLLLRAVRPVPRQNPLTGGFSAASLSPWTGPPCCCADAVPIVCPLTWC